MSNDATTPISAREMLRRQPRRLTLREERQREVEREFSAFERRHFAGYIVEWVRGAEYPLSQLRQNIGHARECIPDWVRLTIQEPPGTKRLNALRALGLSPDASADEIRQAYRHLAKRHHPDRGGNVEAMKRINNAYAALRGK